MEERFERCTKLCDNAKGRLSLYALEKDSKNIKPKCDREIFNVDPADSVFQVTGGMSVSSSKIAARQIELELKRAKLEANHKLALAQAQAHAESAQAQAVAAQALAQVEARHCIEKVELDAEERLIALSECGSMAASRKRGSVSSSQRVRRLLATVDRHLTINLDTETKRGILQAESGNVSPEFNNVILPGNNMGFNYHINQGMANNTLPLKQDVQPIHSLGATTQMQTPFNEQTPSSSTGEATLITYLERQGRNEFIGLANEIGYNGKNIAFVFFENQIRKLMEENPYDERRLEVLRAACVGQPREMVNLFLGSHEKLVYLATH